MRSPLIHRLFCLATALCFAASPIGAQTPGGSLDLDLGDLGFSQEQTQGDSALQVRLENRSKNLKTHQVLGLITLAPMAASLFSGSGASAEEGTDSKRDLHMNLYLASGAMYFTTAYFAIRAPRGENVKRTGATRVHRWLSYVHFPAMVLTPILGYQAKKQIDDGRLPHGLAKYHAEVAGVGAAAFFASFAVLWFDF
jgi:hypothetical protein